jgi:hypothetical protein
MLFGNACDFIVEVSSSNLHRGSGYHVVFVVFLKPSTQILGYYLIIRRYYFLLYAFQFSTVKHSTLYCMSYQQHCKITHTKFTL